LQVFVLAAAVGLPVFLIFSWVFEMTPEGIKRESEIDRNASITPQTGRKLDRVIIVFLALAVVVLLADRFFQPEPAGPGKPEPAAVVQHSPAPQKTGADSTSNPPAGAAGHQDGRSVAVLPFVNMSGDEEQEYFSDGISEELLNVLVRVEGLRVPSRTSSFTFKGSDKNVTEIGRELQVEHVLEGSVRKSGNRIRVTAQLIDVNTDTHLWSETYTRELDDIFAVQDEIAQAIVGALKVTLSGDEQQTLASHSTTDVEAYNQYLLGRHLWNQRTTQSLQVAVASLLKAVELDPDYDQAWAALAETYALFPEYGAGSIEEYIPLGIEAADRALALNPESARALTARAYIRFMYEYDYDTALTDYRRAIELEPGYATAHQWYGELLAVLRRTDEALEQVDIAARLDPRSAVISHVKAWILAGAGRLQEARAQYEQTFQIAPDYPNSVGNMELLELQEGHYDQARHWARRSAQLYNFDPAPNLAIDDAMENPALKPRALELLAASTGIQEGATGKALYLVILGENELALVNLEKAFEAGDPYAVHMNRQALFDPLRSDPRFQAMLRKMNFEP
jgi:TolB-like protein